MKVIMRCALPRAGRSSRERGGESRGVIAKRVEESVEESVEEERIGQSRVQEKGKEMDQQQTAGGRRQRQARGGRYGFWSPTGRALCGDVQESAGRGLWD